MRTKWKCTMYDVHDILPDYDGEQIYLALDEYQRKEIKDILDKESATETPTLVPISSAVDEKKIGVFLQGPNDDKFLKLTDGQMRLLTWLDKNNYLDPDMQIILIPSKNEFEEI